MTNEDLVAYAIAGAAITAIIVQIINDLWVSASLLTPTQRAALLRGLNYLFNLGFILMAVLLRGAFAQGDVFLYVALAFGQAVGSHSGRSLLTNGMSGTLATLSGRGALSHTSAAPSTQADTPDAGVLPTIPRNS